MLAGALLIFGIIVYSFIHWNTFSQLKEAVKQQSESMGITGTMIFRELSLDLDRQSSFDEKNMYVQLVNYTKSEDKGGIRQSTNLLRQQIILPYPAANSFPKDGFANVQVEIEKKKYRMIIYQRPLAINNELVGLLQVATISYNEEQYLTGLRNTLLLSSLLVVFIAFTIGMLIARQALRPIERVIDATKQIGSGSDLSVRIPTNHGNDEIATLVNTLNLMLSRLEKAYNELDEAYRAQRRFVSDASHELRTPLTTIRGNIDLLEKMWLQAKGNQDQQHEQQEKQVIEFSNMHFELSHEAMSDISAEARRMSTLVNDLLALARADAGYTMELNPIDILGLTEAVVRRAQLLPRESSWDVTELSLLQNVQVIGNENYLQQLLFIFIENAFKYTSEGHVKLSAVKTERYVGWKIEDTGIGMNPEQVPHIFDRFYRADESRGITAGTGLGLAIAKWIIDEHQGSVEVATKEGKGTTFIIWLPIYFPKWTQ